MKPPRSSIRRALATASILALLAVTGPEPVHAQATDLPTLSGPWQATARFTDDGEFVLLLDMQARGAGRFEGFTRRGAAADLVGRPRAIAGRVLGVVPPGGALIHFADGRLYRDGDSIRVAGMMRSLMFGSFHVRGVMVNGEIQGRIMRDSLGPTAGTLRLVRSEPGVPVRDYAALAQRIEATFRSHFFDPALLDTPPWRTFFGELHRRFARVGDDAEALATFFMLTPPLRVSHIYLYRSPTMAAKPIEALINEGSSAAAVTTRFPSDSVALMRITDFNAVGEHIRRGFERIDSAGAHTLILDLRGNTGGDVSSMVVVSHLFREQVPAGIFVGNRWYARHGRLPTQAEIATSPLLTDEASTALSIISGVREHGLLRGEVPPAEPHFSGEVLLLVDRAAMSAAEPLAHILRETGRATLIGERTAGEMLSAPPHNVGDGWLLRLPEGDYYGPDGTRLEGRGVAPHIATASLDAFNPVADRLRQRSPHAAAVFRAMAHEERGRWAEATHAWADALRIRPWDHAALMAIARAYAAAWAWEPAFEAYERVLVMSPRDMDASYHIGRIAALSGQRLDRGEALLRQYLERSPAPGSFTHAAAYWRLGRIQQHRGDVAAARASYERAVALEPDNPDYRRSLLRLPR